MIASPSPANEVAAAVLSGVGGPSTAGVCRGTPGTEVAGGESGCALIVADFEGDEGVWIQVRQGIVEEAFDDAEAVGAAV